MVDEPQENDALEGVPTKTGNDVQSELDRMKLELADLLTGDEVGPVIEKLLEEPKLLSKTSLWGVIRDKAGHGWSEGFPKLLQQICDADLPGEADEEAFACLQFEASIRLGGQGRRSNDAQEVQDAIDRLLENERAIFGRYGGNFEEHHHRLLGLLYYELGMAFARKRKYYRHGRIYFERSADHCQHAGDAPSVFQAQEAEMYWAEACNPNGDIGFAKGELADICREARLVLANETDDHRKADFENTEANAALNWARAGRPNMNVDEARAVALEEFAGLSKNPIAMKWGREFRR